MIVPPATHVKRRREATDVSAVRGATDGVAVIRPAACGERDGATVLDHGAMEMRVTALNQIEVECEDILISVIAGP